MTKELAKRRNWEEYFTLMEYCHSLDTMSQAGGKQMAGVDTVHSKGHTPPSFIFLKVIIIRKITDHLMHKNCWGKFLLQVQVKCGFL